MNHDLEKMLDTIGDYEQQIEQLHSRKQGFA